MNLAGEGVLGGGGRVVHWTSLLSPLPDVTTLNQSLFLFFWFLLLHVSSTKDDWPSLACFAART